MNTISNGGTIGLGEIAREANETITTLAIDAAALSDRAKAVHEALGEVDDLLRDDLDDDLDESVEALGLARDLSEIPEARAAIVTAITSLVETRDVVGRALALVACYRKAFPLGLNDVFEDFAGGLDDQHTSLGKLVAALDGVHAIPAINDIIEISTFIVELFRDETVHAAASPADLEVANAAKRILRTLA